MKKVSLRIEDEVLEKLMVLCGTDNVSEAVRIAIMFYLQNNDASENVKTLFPYIGKKPPRIGREAQESQAARRNAEIERRNSADNSRTVRNAETQSVFTAEQRNHLCKL